MNLLNATTENLRRPDVLAATGIVLGMLLVVASPLARLMFPAERAWTAEQAAELSNAQAALHMYGDLGNVTSDQLESMTPTQREAAAAYREVVATYERLGPQLEAARARPDRMARVVKWAGIAVASVAGAVYLARRGAA